MKTMQPPLTLRMAKSSNVESLARLHEEAFPGFLLTKLGLPFLRAYYTLVLEFEGGILLIAEQNGKVVGFVGGFVNPRQFYENLVRRKWRFFMPICRALMLHPSIWLKLADRVINVLCGRREVLYREQSDCELASIGVSPRAVRGGVGSNLVLLFLETARERGALRVYLTTDALQNLAANRFYLKMGFRPSRRWNELSKRPMNEYVMDLKRAA